jgi:hypothetical protein
MTYYGFEIQDNLEIDGTYEVFMYGWAYGFKTLEEAKQYIRDNR